MRYSSYDQSALPGTCIWSEAPTPADHHLIGICYWLRSANTKVSCCIRLGGPRTSIQWSSVLRCWSDLKSLTSCVFAGSTKDRISDCAVGSTVVDENSRRSSFPGAKVRPTIKPSRHLAAQLPKYQRCNAHSLFHPALHSPTIITKRHATSSLAPSHTPRPHSLLRLMTYPPGRGAGRRENAVYPWLQLFQPQ